MKKTAFVSGLGIAALVLLTACSAGTPSAAPTPTERELSANPSWPKNCYIESLLESMPYLTFDTEAGEDGAILLDGRNGNRLGCISDPNNEYGDILTWPTKFAFDKTTDDFKTWDEFIRSGVKDGNKYVETPLAGCKVIYSEYLPNEGDTNPLTDAYAYCNGVTVSFWMPRPWDASKLVFTKVLESIS